MQDTSRKISWQEVGKHNNYNDVWIVIEGKVYNPTSFTEHHPGGANMIQNRAGQDATRDFIDHGHSAGARRKLETMQVGVIDSDSKQDEWQYGKQSQTGVQLFSFVMIGLCFVYSVYVLSMGPGKQ